MKVDIEGIRRIIVAATQPAPWSTHEGRDGGYVVLDAHGMWVADVGHAPHDAEFIAAARVALPAALDELAKLRGLVATVRSRLDNWNWAGLASDAGNGDFDSADDAFADVAAIEKAIADHDKEHGHG